jgi:putative hydrolase
MGPVLEPSERGTAQELALVALDRVVHCLDRSQADAFRTKAFVRARQVVRDLAPAAFEELAAAGGVQQLEGIGSSSATVIEEALRGERTYLERLESSTVVAISEGGQSYRAALRGDCHLHSRWSDGGATVDAMVATAIALGHDYIVLTDHSPRLTVAHGLNEERLQQQLAEVAILNERYAPFQILSGIEVDILEDGSLDHTDAILQSLDVVVASVHSKLKMPAAEMTARMLRAVASPHVDILGHCTGRLIGKRDPSQFDARAVFAACAAAGVAVEINCRPERLDPPDELLALAVEVDCLFSIDSDAHATGQLEWQPFGCDRAAAFGVPIERVINTWPVDQLLAWVQ